MFESTATTSAADVTGDPKRSKHKQPPLVVADGCTCFRLLCHSSPIGCVIGKSGAIIKQLQQETSAKIRVEVLMLGSDDRVITVIGNSSVNRTLAFSKDNSSDESSEFIEVSATQKALIRVFERILFVAAETDGGNLASQGDEDNNLWGYLIT
ncbi:hypothetical protein L1987_07835 [Smallanthus sonchifolius]|uniref:Uncharacterized protein n=1 Tax=Smallanthus sonchifolius TaxID=185202 RepID=A0ACB9JKR0_9ASTR|nr:hypothetical protein L1987_07835 [Smallanthus sonchifolius]